MLKPFNAIVVNFKYLLLSQRRKRMDSGYVKIRHNMQEFSTFCLEGRGDLARELFFVLLADLRKIDECGK